MQSALNSSVLTTTTNSSDRASLYLWYLQYWALCDDLVIFEIIDPDKDILFA